MKLPYFVYPIISKMFIARILVMLVRPESSLAYVNFVWNVIDHTSDPDILWSILISRK